MPEEVNEPGASQLPLPAIEIPLNSLLLISALVQPILRRRLSTWMVARNRLAYQPSFRCSERLEQGRRDQS